MTFFGFSRHKRAHNLDGVQSVCVFFFFFFGFQLFRVDWMYANLVWFVSKEMCDNFINLNCERRTNMQIRSSLYFVLTKSFEIIVH